MVQRKFRLGTASFIYHDESLIENVRRLVNHVDDIELVLYDTEDYGTNLPDATTIAELKAIAHANDLSYTVHLPIDLDGRDERSFEKIVRAIDATHTRTGRVCVASGWTIGAG